MRSLIFAAILVSGAAANASSRFCEFQAKAAVTAMTQVNATVGDVINVLSENNNVWQIEASEQGIGRDLYEVKTTGGHDCLVTSVKAKTRPTTRP